MRVIINYDKHNYVFSLFTFPEPLNPLIPGYCPVGIKCAAVPLHRAALWQADLSLKPDFYHISRLGKDHRHCSRCAARQQPCPESYICDLNNIVMENDISKYD